MKKLSEKIQFRLGAVFGAVIIIAAALGILWTENRVHTFQREYLLTYDSSATPDEKFNLLYNFPGYRGDNIHNAQLRSTAEQYIRDLCADEYNHDKLKRLLYHELLMPHVHAGELIKYVKPDEESLNAMDGAKERHGYFYHSNLTQWYIGNLIKLAAHKQKNINVLSWIRSSDVPVANDKALAALEELISKKEIHPEMNEDILYEFCKRASSGHISGVLATQSDSTNAWYMYNFFVEKKPSLRDYLHIYEAYSCEPRLAVDWKCQIAYDVKQKMEILAIKHCIRKQ